MLRKFIIEFLKGFWASLQGIRIIHKLDRPQHEQVEAVKRSHGDVSSKRTVLENRRRKNVGDKMSSASQKELDNKASSLLRIFECIVANVASVLFIVILTSFFELFSPSFVSLAVKYGLGSLLLPPVRLFSALWFADVAGTAQRFSGVTGNRITDLSKAASEFIFAIFLELAFLLQAQLIYYVEIPIMSKVLGFVCMALLHSMYCFDYIWMTNCLSLNTRIALIEQNWPYFLGFGAFLTVTTNLSADFMINGCIFGALFPFFIVSSCIVDAGTTKSFIKERSTEIPPIHFFCLAQLFINRISNVVFGRVSC